MDDRALDLDVTDARGAADPRELLGLAEERLRRFGIGEFDEIDDFPMLAIDEMPVVDTVIAESTEPPSGTGEPGLPPAAPFVMP